MTNDKATGLEALLRRMEARHQGIDRQSRLTRAVCQAARQELTPRQLECVLLYYSNRAQSVKAIAGQLGVCPSTVCRHLKKARMRLERVLQYGYFPVWEEEDTL